MSTSTSITGVAHNELASQLLKVMPDAVFLVTADSHRILAANSRAEELTCQSSNDLINRPLTAIFTLPVGCDLAAFFASESSPTEEQSSLLIHLQADVDQLQPLVATGHTVEADDNHVWIMTVHPPQPNESSDLWDRLAHSENRVRQLFDESPIAQFEMDWSGIQNRLQTIRNSGVSNLRAWLEESPESLAELSQQARITAVNHGALDMFEVDSIEEFAGSLSSILRQDSLRVFKEHLLFRLEGGQTFEAENVAYTISGKRLHVHIRASPDVHAGYSWNRIYASVSNITQRRHAETLRDGQQRVLESLAAVNPVATVLGKLTSELERQSPHIRAAVFHATSPDNKLRLVANGTSAEEIVTTIDSVPLGDLYVETDQHSDIPVSDIECQEQGNEQEQVPAPVGIRISRSATACGYRCGVLKPATGPDGQLLGLLAVFHTESQEFTEHEAAAIASFTDLTGLVIQHDQHRQALTVRTDQLQTVFDNYPDALLRISPDGTILESYSGHELTEFLGLFEVPSNQTLWHLLPPVAAVKLHAAIDDVAAAGISQEAIHFSVDHDEDCREFEIRLLPLPSSAEQIAILRDVTQLKQAELKLEYASEQFRYFFNSSPDAIFVESPDGVVLDANLAACRLHKLSLNKLIGQDVLSLIPPDDRPAATTRLDFLVTGELSEFESRSLQSDGQVVPVGVRISPITYNGSPALLLHVRDITQQKNEEEQKRKHERQLAHVSRLTMMGQLVAGIAHEIRQPLWSLSTFADVCVESLSRPDFAERLPQIRDVASKVVSEARRVNAITTRMFSFARTGTTERTVANIHDIVHDAVAMTAGQARSSRITTTIDIETDIPTIVCDRVLIEQTLANLLNNAYAALSIHPSDAREVIVEICVDTEDPDYISASVRDNGPGLPKGIPTEQLFEGFFTTGQSGLGLGLALSRSFVEDHGGTIRAEQLPDNGMEFVFTLRVDGGKNTDAI